MLPAVPLKVLLNRVAVVITAPTVPPAFVQLPVPTAGLFPANVVLVKPHILTPVWSSPALAGVGFCKKLITTSSLELGQGGFVIVNNPISSDTIGRSKTPIYLGNIFGNVFRINRVIALQGLNAIVH